jgi:CDP-diacylglycerol---serine O-phosphatidyltransferase
LGILFTCNYKLDFAFYFLIIAAVFDFFDGFAARILKVSSNIGKDLDSLADMVTFGLLPGFIMYKMIALSVLNFDSRLATDVYTLFLIEEHTLAAFENIGIKNIPFLFLPFIGFFIPVFSAIRLANFNNDTRQGTSFIGLPTPANGMLISSLGYILVSQLENASLTSISTFVFSPIFLISLTLILCYLLNAEIPLFALKFKNFGWTDNKIRFIFLGISLVALIVLQWMAIPLIIIFYVLQSVIANYLKLV